MKLSSCTRRKHDDDKFLPKLTGLGWSDDEDDVVIEDSEEEEEQPTQSKSPVSVDEDGPQNGVVEYGTANHQNGHVSESDSDSSYTNEVVETEKIIVDSEGEMEEEDVDDLVEEDQCADRQINQTTKKKKSVSWDPNDQILNSLPKKPSSKRRSIRLASDFDISTPSQRQLGAKFPPTSLSLNKNERKKVVEDSSDSEENENMIWKTPIESAAAPPKSDPPNQELLDDMLQILLKMKNEIGDSGGSENANSDQNLEFVKSIKEKIDEFAESIMSSQNQNDDQQDKKKIVDI